MSSVATAPVRGVVVVDGGAAVVAIARRRLSRSLQP